MELSGRLDSAIPDHIKHNSDRFEAPWSPGGTQSAAVDVR